MVYSGGPNCTSTTIQRRVFTAGKGKLGIYWRLGYKKGPTVYLYNLKIIFFYLQQWANVVPQQFAHIRDGVKTIPKEAFAVRVFFLPLFIINEYNFQTKKN
jgi:hypothetical protein